MIEVVSADLLRCQECEFLDQRRASIKRKGLLRLSSTLR